MNNTLRGGCSRQAWHHCQLNCPLIRAPPTECIYIRHVRRYENIWTTAPRRSVIAGERFTDHAQSKFHIGVIDVDVGYHAHPIGVDRHTQDVACCNALEEFA